MSEIESRDLPGQPTVPGTKRRRRRGGVEGSTLPAGRADSMRHIGPYDSMSPTYAAIVAWIEEQGATPSGTPWEVYYSDQPLRNGPGPIAPVNWIGAEVCSTPIPTLAAGNPRGD